MLLPFLLLQFIRDECSSSYCTHWFQISELKLDGTQCGNYLVRNIKSFI